MEAITVCPTPAPSYSDVQPIIERECATACHNNKTIDPSTKLPIWSLSTYQDLSDWQDLLRSDISSCAMPPADAGAYVTVDERRIILQWVKCGLPM